MVYSDMRRVLQADIFIKFVVFLIHEVTEVVVVVFSCQSDNSSLRYLEKRTLCP